MKYWISYSGGIASAVSVLIAHAAKLNYSVVFADTLIEDEDLHRFTNDLCKVIDIDLITLSTGKTPWDVFRDHRYIGNTRTAHCSVDLKTKPVMRFLEMNAEPSDPLVLGMDWSELDRIERAQRVWDRPVVSLLNEYKVTRPMYKSILKGYGLTPPRLYDYGFPHNNCGGVRSYLTLAEFEALYNSGDINIDPYDYGGCGCFTDAIEE